MTETPMSVPAESPRGFWWFFMAAWTAYAALFASAILITGEASGPSLAEGLAGLVSPIVLSVPLAVFRRHLLSVDRSFGRTVLVHAGLAGGYGIGCVALSVLAAAALRRLMAPGTTGPLPLVGWMLNALFLYLALAGMLMWFESLARVAESRATIAREAMLRSQAEAEAVRARFNPHFVFNTLHSLILLVHRDPDAAERAITDVADLIRYGSLIERRRIDVVPLHQELAIARRYVALETLRFGERLHVRWDVPDDVMHCGIPPLALQSLIENAVKHGAAPLSRATIIHIGARRVDDDLETTVRDDGAGTGPKGVLPGEGRGLGLLRQRLLAVFGGAARLDWEAPVCGGFTVSMRMPARHTGPVDLPGIDDEPEAA